MPKSDLFGNEYAPGGSLRAGNCAGNFTIPQGNYFVVRDLTTGEPYGIYVNNGVLNSVKLDENFYPVEPLT